MEKPMTLLKAIVRPDKIDQVKEALGQLGIAGMTVTEVRGHGRQKGHKAVYRGKEYVVDLVPKVQIEVVVEDSLSEPTVRAMIQAARTGEIGDGRIFAVPVAHCYKIRTGKLDIL
jgi:nitrogen regulatory protein PII